MKVSTLPFLSLFRQRNFMLLWSGDLISMIGDWGLQVALPFYVYQQTGSALATGLTFIMQRLAQLLFGLFAGVLVDRWDRKRLLIVTNLLQAILLPFMLLGHNANSFWIIYLVLFLEVLLAQLTYPTFQAVLPNTVATDDLVSANSALSISNNVSRLIGPPLGGLLITLLGLNAIVFVDAASFLFAAFTSLFLSLPTMPISKSTVQQEHMLATWFKFWYEWLDGLRLVVRERWMFAIFVLVGLGNLSDGILSIMLVPFVYTILHGDAQIFSWMLIAGAIGGLIGGMLLPRLRLLTTPSRLIWIGGTMIGALMILMISFPSIPLALALSGLSGVGAVGFGVGTSTLLQSGAPDQYRGRIFSSYSTTLALMSLAGMSFTSALGNQIGIIPMLYLAAGIALLSGLLARPWLRHTLPAGQYVAS